MKSRSDSINKSKDERKGTPRGREKFFSRIFGSEFDEFLGKARSVWEIKIFEEIKLRRGITFQEVRTRSKNQTHGKDKGRSL
jgi:hypothetical protein